MLKRIIFALCLLASPVLAQDKVFTLNAPEALVETGLMKHLLPRFSLKTGIRITLGAEGAEAAFGDDGTPVFRRGEVIWHFKAEGGAHPEAFLKWLQSDVGKRTIEAFAPEGTALFSADVAVQVVAAPIALSGDAKQGERVSLAQCGRCHVINASNRMQTIGSTPSFALMRSFPDWQDRFETFFLLRPHPAFTQVVDLTEPFPEHLPPAIVPIEVTLEEIDAITAYVSTLTPAELGAPLKRQ